MQDNTWAFMYFTTAMLTGTMIVGMFLLVPANHAVGAVVVGLVAVALIVGSLPIRKGTAMGIEWIMDPLFYHPGVDSGGQTTDSTCKSVLADPEAHGARAPGLATGNRPHGSTPAV